MTEVRRINNQRFISLLSLVGNDRFERLNPIKRNFKLRLFEGTDWDRPPKCDRCEKLESECECPPIVVDQVVPAPEKQQVQIRKEKRKKGKQVTVIKGIQFANDDQQKAMLTELKNDCGSGGRIAEEGLEIQGDHTERIARFLDQRNYRNRILR